MSLLRTAMVYAGTLMACGCAVFPAHSSTATPPKRVTLRICLAQAEPRDGYLAIADEHGQPLNVAPDALATERDVRRASVYENPQRRLIRLEFKPLATARLDAATADHVGGRVAVFVDDELIMSPALRAPLSAGRFFLDGGFSPTRTADIVHSLNRPAPPTETTK